MATVFREKKDDLWFLQETSRKTRKDAWLH